MENTVAEKITYDSYSYPENRFFEYLRKVFFVEKLYNVTGIILLIVFGVILGIGIGLEGPLFGVLLIGAIIAYPLLYGLFAYPKFGIIVLMIMSYMLFVLGQLGIDGPVGTIMDTLQVILAIGTLVKIKAEKDWAYFKNPVTTVVLIWLGYNLLELVNPTAGSRLAWLYSVRPIAIVTLSYFVFIYHIRSVEFIRVVFKVWLVLTIIGAAYAFKQEYIGFNAHEQAYLDIPSVANLLFIDGHWRKFSIFSDPVAFSYNMVMPAIFLICLFLLPIKRWKKIVSAILILFFFRRDAVFRHPRS